MGKYKVGDRVVARDGNNIYLATVKGSYRSLYGYNIIGDDNSYSIVPDESGPGVKWAWYSENDLIPIDRIFETPPTKTIFLPIQELMNYYLLDCSKALAKEAYIYGIQDAKPTTPTLTGWISYWRKTIEEHPNWHISYKSEQRK